MGLTVETLTIRNFSDLGRARAGNLPPEEIRQITVTALVDTGATFVGLYQAHIDALGLIPDDRTHPIRTANGVVHQVKYGGAQLELLGRKGSVDIFPVDESIPPILGVLLLEALDLVVDPVNQRVMFNPEHGEEETHLLLHQTVAGGRM